MNKVVIVALTLLGLGYAQGPEAKPGILLQRIIEPDNYPGTPANRQAAAVLFLSFVDHMAQQVEIKTKNRPIPATKLVELRLHYRASQFGPQFVSVSLGENNGAPQEAYRFALALDTDTAKEANNAMDKLVGRLFVTSH